MKVIKVGNNSQSRIAQACDRCRSKKIRCDGIRPCCTQCANVGFECKTSDKLSRRAFPRGYTESLEDRVRSLEAEVRELKELLDEKDEKIDMLSRLHSFSSPSRKGSSSLSPTASAEVKADLNVTKEDYVHVEIPENQDAQAPANGPSTTNAFIGMIPAASSLDVTHFSRFLQIQNASRWQAFGRHSSRIFLCPLSIEFVREPFTKFSIQGPSSSSLRSIHQHIFSRMGTSSSSITSTHTSEIIRRLPRRSRVSTE